MNKITIIVSSIISTIVLLSVINYNQNEKNELKNKKIELIRRKAERRDSIATQISDSLIIKESKQKPTLVSSDIVATWYQAHGSKTYSGEIFHKDSLTAAYYTKMGSFLRVTNKSNGKSVIVRVTDRMGSKNKNKIDLSKKAFEEIASINSGRIKVTIEVIN